MEEIKVMEVQKLLDNSLETMHGETQEWISDIRFRKDELGFFAHLLEKNRGKSGASPVMNEKMKSLRKQIIGFESNTLAELLENSTRHESDLSGLLHVGKVDVQQYRQNHREMMKKVAEMDRMMRELKVELIKFIKAL